MDKIRQKLKMYAHHPASFLLALLVWISAIFTAVTPVSYTHLCKEKHCIIYGNCRRIIRYRRRTFISCRLGKISSDVYKRQVWSRRETKS